MARADGLIARPGGVRGLGHGSSLVGGRPLAVPANWEYFDYNTAGLSPSLGAGQDPLVPLVGDVADQHEPGAPNESETAELATTGWANGVRYTNWFEEWTAATRLAEYGGTLYPCDHCYQYAVVTRQLGLVDAGFSLRAGPAPLQWIWILAWLSDPEGGVPSMSFRLSYDGEVVDENEGDLPVSLLAGAAISIRARQVVPSKDIVIEFWNDTQDDEASGVNLAIIGRVGYLDPGRPPWETDL